MNKKEAIEKVKTMAVETFFSGTLFVKQQEVIAIIEQIGEPTSGRAEEAPRYLRNVLARLRELPEHDRKVWMDEIMHEFANDYGSVKYTLGYEQGKFDGAVEAEKSNKVVIPQFVAEWVEKCKTFKNFAVSLSFALQPSVWEANRLSDKCIEWLTDAENQDIFARAWLDGYEVEKEKLYTARLKLVTQNKEGYLNRNCKDNDFFIDDLRVFSGEYQTRFTRSELEDLDIWDNPVFEIKEVE